MLVDDAIVVVELMEVKMSEGMDRLEAATYAFKTNGMTLCFGTMITCASFLPIAFANSNVSEFAGSPFPGHHHDPHVLLVCFPNRCPHLGL